MPLSKTEYAYQTIKKKIISCELAPQATVSEAALQDELSISRTPVREALQALAKESFIDIFPRKGIVVAPISMDLVKEVYDARMVVEPIAAQRACGVISDAFLTNIWKKMTNPPRGLTKRAEAEYQNNLDNALHSELTNYLQNRFFQDELRLVYEHQQRIRNYFFGMETDETVLQEHDTIIQSLLARKKDELFAYAAAHVENAKRRAFYHILKI